MGKRPNFIPCIELDQVEVAVRCPLSAVVFWLAVACLCLVEERGLFLDPRILFLNGKEAPSLRASLRSHACHPPTNRMRPSA